MEPSLSERVGLVIPDEPFEVGPRDCHIEIPNPALSAPPPLRPSHSGPEESVPAAYVELSRHLKLLYILYGASTSLETLAIMYMLNTRVGVPVPYLPTYGAIAFLPWSLKPLYASMMEIMFQTPRFRLVAVLLSLNALCIAGTAFLTPNAIVACFSLAFAKNIFSAWAEFCLGVTLIDQAKSTTRSVSPTLMAEQYASPAFFDKLVAGFQAQAATSRNAGSLGSNVLALTILAHRKWAYSEESISYAVALQLLLASAFMNFVGAFYVYYHQDGFLADSIPLVTHTRVQSLDEEESIGKQAKDMGVQKYPTQSCGLNALSERSEIRITEDDLCDAALAAFESLRRCRDSDDESFPSHHSDISAAESGNSSCGYVSIDENENQGNSSTFSGGNITLVVFLQLIIVAIALKGPVVDIASDLLWNTFVLACVLGFLATGLAMYLKLPAFSSMDWLTHRTGIFLILRHAVPSDSMVVSSFFYSLFSSTPIILQLVTMAGMAATTVGSWTYGRYLAPYSSGASLKKVIVGTTFLSMFVSFGMVVLVGAIGDNINKSKSVLVLAMAFIAHFTSMFSAELAFLPDVIIATAACKPTINENDEESDVNFPSFAPDRDDISSGLAISTREVKSSSSSAMRYGAMVSCIDFGDQLGAMLGGPLAALLQVSREHGWYRLDWFIAISALSSILPLFFLWLLSNQRSDGRAQ